MELIVIDPKRWGNEVAPDAVVNPLVLRFRPTDLVQVDAEHLEEFERYFEENVGFPPPKHENIQGLTEGIWSHGWMLSGTSGGGWDDAIPY